MKRRSTIACWLLCFVQAAWGVGEEEVSVAASTTWTAALAREAGVPESRITVLTPVTLGHPPEYQLRFSDLRKVYEADIVLVGGYEVMAARLKAQKETLLQGDLLQVKTTYALEDMGTSVRAIATRIGTEKKAEENLVVLHALYRSMRRTIEARGLGGASVLVHRFQEPLARELGFEVKGIFGPSPPEVREIREASREAPVFIIDNFHNPVGKALVEVSRGAKRVVWINFPGEGGTVHIGDVVKYNVEKLNH